MNEKKSTATSKKKVEMSGKTFCEDELIRTASNKHGVIYRMGGRLFTLIYPMGGDRISWRSGEEVTRVGRFSIRRTPVFTCGGKQYTPTTGPLIREKIAGKMKTH